MIRKNCFNFFHFIKLKTKFSPFWGGARPKNLGALSKSAVGGARSEVTAKRVARSEGHKAPRIPTVKCRLVTDILFV